MKVKINGMVRKTEYSAREPQYQEIIKSVFQHYDIQGNITGASHNGGTKYSVYLSGKPTVSPVDLTDVKTDPLANDLIAFKFNLESKTIRVKVYYVGNTNNVEFDRPIVGTGVYIGEDIFTVYYLTDGEVTTENVANRMIQQGFLATTFYADGTHSNESVYDKHIHKESKCH